MCTAIGDFVYDSDYDQEIYSGSTEDFFISKFDMKNRDPVHRAIVSTYFAFTSLSTVGFGDYHPRSDMERLIGAFILMFGVAIFSYIMGIFINIVDTLKTYNEDPDYGSELYRFFGTIKKFNNNQKLDVKLRNEIEEYFDYRWSHDKNSALTYDDNH
jgi:hypothetical protein